jgi:hypothetical protein
MVARCRGARRTPRQVHQQWRCCCRNTAIVVAVKVVAVKVVAVKVVAVKVVAVKVVAVKVVAAEVVDVEPARISNALETLARVS